MTTETTMSALIDAWVKGGQVDPFQAAAFALRCIDLFERADCDEMTFEIGNRTVTVRRTWQKLTSEQVQHARLD